MAERASHPETAPLSKQEKGLILIGWLLLLIFVAFFLHWWVCQQNFALCGSNMAERLQKAQARTLFWSESIPAAALTAPREFRGELFHLVSYVAVRIHGPSFRTFLAVNALFLLLFIAAVGWLGVMTAGGWAGLLAALLGTLTPVVLWHVRAINHDLPMAAMSLLALAALLKTEHFSRWGWSLIFGVLLGLALLAKITAPACLFPAIAASFVIGCSPANRRRGIRLRSQLVGLILGLSVGALTAAPWYVPRLAILWQEWFYHLGRPDSPTFHDVSGKPIGVLLLNVIGFVLLPLFALSVPLSIVRRIRNTGVLYSFFVPVFLFLLVKPTGFERFMLAPIGAMAVLAGAALVFRKKSAINAYLAAIILGCCIILFLYSQQGVGGKSATIRNIVQTPGCSTFDNYDPAVEKIRRIIGDKQEPTIVYLSQMPNAWFQTDTWKILIREAVPTARLGLIDAIHARHYRDYLAVGEVLSQADLFIYQSPLNGPDWPDTAHFDDQIMMLFPGEEPFLENRRWIYEHLIVPAAPAFQFERAVNQCYLQGCSLIYFYRRRPDSELAEWRAPESWRIPPIDNTPPPPDGVKALRHVPPGPESNVGETP